MSYNLRYQFTFDDVSEDLTYVVKLNHWNYPGSVEPDLIPSDDPLHFGWAYDEAGVDNPHGLIAITSVSMTLIDRKGRFTALAAIEEQEVECVITADGTELFRGFVKPGNYGYDRYEDTFTTIVAVRGEAFLKNKLYVTDSGGLYTGRVSPLQIIRNCFEKTGNNGIIGTGMYWIPYLTNQLTTSHDVLKRLIVDQSQLKDKDGQAITCWSALQIILRQYQLQLFDDAGSWFVLQRRRVVDTANNEFEIYTHTTLDVQAALDTDYALDIFDTNNIALQGYQIVHTVPYKYASAIYNHLTPSNEGIGNPSFEAVIESSGSTASNNWIPVGSTYTIDLVPNAPDADGAGVNSLRVEAAYLTSAASSIPADLIVNDYVKQSTGTTIEGNASRKLQFNFHYSYHVKGSFNYGDAYFLVRIKVGDWWLYYDSTNNVYDWTKTPASSSHYIYTAFGNPNPSHWQNTTIDTEEMNDGVDDVTGELYIELYGVVEDYNGTATQESLYGLWDNLSFTLIGADGLAENEATQFTSVYIDSNNVESPETAVLLYGDGPTSGHVRRQTIEDGSDAVVDVPGDWQFGRTFTSASGVDHTAFWVEELLKQHRYPLMRASFQIEFTDGILNNYNPAMVFRDKRVLQLEQAALTSDTTIRVTIDTTIDPQKYGVIQPRRQITIGGTETATVLHVIYVEENEYDLILESGLSAGYVEGTEVLQEIIFTWTQLSYSARHKVLSVEAIELAHDEGTLTSCNYDVKPGSLKADTLPSLEGTACFGVVSKNGPDTLYFVNGSKQIKKAPIDRSTTGWSSTIIRTETATTIIDFVVDQAAGKMFTVIANTGDDNRYIQVADLEGTVPSTIVTVTPVNASFPPNVRICLDRPNQRIFCAITNYTSGDQTRVYSYAGVLIQSAGFIRDATSIGAPAVSEDGTYMVYQTSGGGTKRMQKYDYATNANTDIETIGSGINLSAHSFIDHAEGKLFIEAAGDDEIQSWPTPGGGSFSTVITTAGTTEFGLAGDRVFQKLYVGTTNNLIKEYNYDGTGEQTVIDESVGGSDISHIDLGV